MEINVNKYNFYVASAGGTIQCISNIQEKTKYKVLEDISEVSALEFGESENELIIGDINGKVCNYDVVLNTHKKINNIKGDGPIVGIGCHDKCLIIGKQSGLINIWNSKMVHHFSIGLKVNSSLNCMVYNKMTKNVATGGERNELKLWDIDKQQCIFNAKSLGHDELNLPIDTSIRSICFVQDDNTCICATKEGHVLVYDSRAQRKPVSKFFEKKASYTTIAPYENRKCFVGTTKGYMQLLDMKTGKCLSTYTDFTGSVTSIACDLVEPYVATTSLDRFLRVFDINTKKLIQKVYLKQNLTKLLMKPVIKEEVNENVLDKDLTDDYDILFNNMETISEDIKVPRKRKTKNKQIKLKKTKSE